MNKIRIFVLGVCFLFSASANAECIKEAQVTQWEVIASNKVVAYSGESYLAFVTTRGGYMQIGKSVTLRFFSPSICNGDDLVVNGVSDGVSYVKLIRNK